jgi:hypothetical protein
MTHRKGIPLGFTSENLNRDSELNDYLRMRDRERIRAELADVQGQARRPRTNRAAPASWNERYVY